MKDSTDVLYKSYIYSISPKITLIYLYFDLF